MGSSWGSINSQVHVANNFSDRKIYVIVMPNPDWAWLDVGAMVAQMVVETFVAVCTAGVAAPAEAAAMAASAARIGRIAQGVNTIRKLVTLVKELKIFRLALLGATKAWEGYNLNEDISGVISAAESSVMTTQASLANQNLKAYLEQNAVSIGPKAEMLVNTVEYAKFIDAMAPSYWGAISGCSTVQIAIIDENLEYAASFNSGADDSYIADPSCVYRAIYGTIWQRDSSGMKAWLDTSAPDPVIPQAGDCLVGLGSDGMLHARAKDTPDWAPVPNSKTSSMIQIHGMPDGTLLGVSSDGRMWVKGRLTSPSWTQLPMNGGSVKAAAPWMSSNWKDLAFIAIGMDKYLWAKWGLDASWGSAANNTVQLSALTTFPDGRIIGVGLFDKKLYGKPAPNDVWALLPNNNASVSSLCAMPNGAVFGLGTDSAHKARSTWTDPWAPMTTTQSLVSVAYMFPPAALIGVGTDNQLYTRATLTSPWTLVKGSGSVKSVTALQDGTLVAVGTNNGLWHRPTLAFPWTEIPSSGSVVAITCTPDAKLLAVGTDGNLHTRANLDVGCPWELVPNSGSMSSVVSLVDGSILGVGTDNTLYRRATLNDAWVKIPNSAGVKSVANLRDGTIVGVGLDNTLRTWTNDAWTAVANSGSVTAIFVQK